MHSQARQHWPQRHSLGQPQADSWFSFFCAATCVFTPYTGLLWTIIYNYQVSKGFSNAPQAHGKKGGVKDLLLEVGTAVL